MKERPILFSSEMVRAILDRRKTQTRRIVKSHPKIVHALYSDGTLETEQIFRNPNTRVRCPFGVPGDHLWVRENVIIAPKNFAEPAQSCVTDTDGDPRYVQYLATQPDTEVARAYGLKITPLIYMPRWASRITLEVTDIRVERLQAISEEDAKAEGIWKYGDETCWKIYTPTTSFGTSDPRRSFESLWTSINGADSWGLNPWVWVVSFKRIQP